MVDPSIKMHLCQTKTVLWTLLACLSGVGQVRLALAQEEKAVQTPGKTGPAPQQSEPGVQKVGHLDHPRLSECSGVVASRQHPGILWTHSDGGGGRKQTVFLYAVERTGRTVGEFRISGHLEDWEDIAIDESNRLYIGDLGNNDKARRELAVYRVDEPDPTSKVKNILIKDAWRLRFPEAPFDSESLFVWNGHGYIVSKVTNDERAQIYSFPLAVRKEPVVLELVATTKIESPVAGADISPDGKLLAFIAKSGAFVYRIDGDPARAGKGKPYQRKFKDSKAEGCTFVPDGLLVTAEDRDIFLFTDEPFLWKSQTSPTASTH
jgi:hypothetical protein